jgi:uncharacterized membrane protein
LKTTDLSLTIPFFSQVLFGHLTLTPTRCFVVTFAPILLTAYGLLRGSLSRSGATVAVFVGAILSLAHTSFLFSLLVFFLTASKATRFREEEKRKMEGRGFKKGGKRNWVQVLCNGGVATELALLYLLDVGCVDAPLDFTEHYRASWLGSALLGAIACCNGDTWASELGAVWSERSPRLITR